MSNSDDLLAIFTTGLPLSDRLGRRLRAEWAKPEGRVRALWVAKLLDEYGYTQEQVALEVPAGAGRKRGAFNRFR